MTCLFEDCLCYNHFNKLDNLKIMKNKMTKKCWLMIGALALVLLGWVVYAKMTAAPGQYDALAKCISDSGAKFYGASWCPHCKTQKEVFGKSAKYLPYVECSMPGSNAVSLMCKNANIESLPTWVLPDGSRLIGTQTIETLAEKTACQL